MICFLNEVAWTRFVFLYAEEEGYLVLPSVGENEAQLMQLLAD